MNTSLRNCGHLREFELQQAYYEDTAALYDEMHVAGNDEHDFALSILAGLARHLRSRSILDVGSGTGRAIRRLKADLPEVEILGVEPCEALRRIAIHNFDIPEQNILPGDALSLKFGNQSFDVVCAFGVLHHIKTPDVAVGEMLRVARQAVFISDSNNFGQGSTLSRLVKQTLDLLGLWKLTNLLKTRGRGYMISEGDGLSYSYSIFNNYAMIRKKCSSVHMVNTIGEPPNLYRTAGHVALVGLLK